MRGVVDGRLARQLLKRNALVTEPLLGHVGLQREADAGDRHSVGCEPRDGGIDSNHTAVRIEKRPAGIAPIEACFRLEHRLAFRRLQVFKLRADGSCGQRPEPALRGMPNGYDAVADLDPVGILELEHGKRSGRPIELQQSQIQRL